MSITSAGVVHKHGLPSNPCAGSGCVPVTATTSVVLSNQSTSFSGTGVSASTNNQPNTQPNSSKNSTDILEILRLHRCRVLKRVPKASRIPAADKLADTLRHVVSDPDNLDSWIKLLLFTFSCFSVPGQRGGKRHATSLTSKINKAVAEFPSSITFTGHPAVMQRKPSNQRTPSDNLAARVSSKLEDGDVRGAIRLAASDDVIAPFDDITATVLRDKHPPRATDIEPTTSPPLCTDQCLLLQDSDVAAAIRSFAPGSAGGPDGLRPQHLKDLTSASAGDAGLRLLSAVTEFSNLCLRGRVPVEIQPVFCGASLLALKKKDGGLRPIAVGNTLRRLVAKAACKLVTSKLVDRFVPVQLGFGVPRATEAAAHAARRYISDLPPGHGLLKLDFSNALNNIRREAIFAAVRQDIP
jgi:hypothetical protein